MRIRCKSEGVLGKLNIQQKRDMWEDIWGRLYVTSNVFEGLKRKGGRSIKKLTERKLEIRQMLASDRAKKTMNHN